MSPASTIRLSGLRGARRHDIVAALASLPESYRRSDVDGALVAVDGSGAWQDRVAQEIAAGARGVLVVAPHTRRETLPAPGDRDASGRSIPVVIGTPWRHNAIVDRMAPDFRALSGRGVLLEARAAIDSADELDDATIGLLVAAQALTGERFSAGHVTRRAHVQVTQAVADSGLHLVAVAQMRPGGVGQADLRLVAGDRGAWARIPPPASAAPGIGRAVGPDGASSPVTEFTSTYRMALLRLRDAVLHEIPVDDVDAYEAAAVSLRRSAPPARRPGA